MEEPYIPDSNNGTIDIVFRPTSYHNLNVGTKANSTVFDVEDAIYSAFLIVFDNQGRCILRDPLTITDNRTISARTLKTDRSLSSATVCVIVNVPQAFVNEWTSDNNDNYTSDLDKFMHAEIDYSSDDSPFSFAAQSTTTPCVGIPQVVLNDETKQCFPMFGYTNRPCDLSMSGAVQIEIKRLFARIDLNVSLDITEDDSILTSKPQFTLNDCEIFNIPQKVSLITSDRTSCAAVTGDQAGALLASEVMASFNLSNVNSETSVDNIVSNQTTGKSIYFYVPEHKLGITDPANADQKNKPLIIDDTPYKALYATISGILVDGSGVSHDAKYHLYFGLNSTNDFDINRNTKYNNSLTITGISEKESDHRVELEQLDGFVESLVTKGKTANCYIIGATGTYLLPAYRGAFNNMADADICDEGYNEVLVCDNPNITIEINEELSKQSTIVLTISHSASIQNIVMTGNAVIARRKKTTGEIDWSWHLWFVPGITIDTDDVGLSMGEQSIGGVITESMKNDEMMDRNLGVYTTSSDLSGWDPATTPGVYYKYGRKEPFFAGRKMDGTTVAAQYHGDAASTYMAWSGDKKSKTDPCPIGYRVPSKSVWNDMSGVLKINNTATNSFGYIAVIAYPYSGYIDSDNNLQGAESDGGQSQPDLSNVKIPKKQDGSNWNATENIYSKPGYNPIVCSSIEYKTVDLDKAGYLLTTSNGSDDLLKYYYKEDGIELIKCTYIQGTWEQKGITRYWVAKYTSDQKKNTITKTGAELKLEDPALYEAILQGIKDETSSWLGGIWDSVTGFFNFSADLEWTSVNSNYGYQVRCVKEKQ